jgi:hypothetical protein
MKADQKNFSQKAKKVIDKMLMQSMVTKVDSAFLLRLILDLQAYATTAYSHIARFLGDFSRTSPDICIFVCDVLLERIRRGVECDHVAYRQRQLCEVRFLAELVVAEVLPFQIAIDVCRLILGLGQPNPSSYLIKVEGSNVKRKLQIEYSHADFFKAEMICAILEVLVPCIKTGPNLAELAYPIVVWLQLFVLVRAPIPPITCFRIGDLIDNLEYQKVFQLPIRYDTIEELKQVHPAQWPLLQTSNPYEMDKVPPRTTSTKRTTTMPMESDDESYDSENDQQCEAAFLAELAEFKQEMEHESVPDRNRRVVVPLELLNTTNPPKPVERQERHGPPREFQFVVEKGKKTETIVINLGA